MNITLILTYDIIEFEILWLWIIYHDEAKIACSAYIRLYVYSHIMKIRSNMSGQMQE